MIFDVRRLKEIAEVEFGDVVEVVIIEDINQLRIILKDGSYADVWYSLKLKDRYSYHWERKHLDGTIYRHDNAPHQKWLNITTFPKHFHDGTEEKVVLSNIDEDPDKGLKEFLSFIRQKL